MQSSSQNLHSVDSKKSIVQYKINLDKVDENLREEIKAKLGEENLHLSLSQDQLQD